jgi:hypothetical protein
MNRWLVALPPAGGARQAAEHLYTAFTHILPAGAVRSFDFMKYCAAFMQMLKSGDETIVADLAGQSLVIKCLEYDVTHLVVPALCPVTLFILSLLRKKGIMTIHWFIEDYRRVTDWQDILPGYDLFLAVQKGSLQAACEKAGTRFSYLPTAASQASLMISGCRDMHRRTADVVFIGLPSAYRVDMLEYLYDQGITLLIAGEGWNNYSGRLDGSIRHRTWIGAEQSALVLRDAPIALNMSFKSPDGVGADVQLSPRVYDILAAGSLLLTEDVPLLHETLAGCTYHTFLNKFDAAGKVRHLLSILNNPDTRGQIRDTAALIKQDHTWEKRAERIVTLTEYAIKG